MSPRAPSRAVPAFDQQQLVLGSFRLERVLGQGAFATAYLAEQIGTDRRAVVKIAHAHLIHGEQGRIVRDRFASEVRAATRVTHPNLVTIYTSGETEDGLPALAMEYLHGETLGQRLRRGELLTIDELCRAFAQLASALERVHASKIIHRDVSPENVFLTSGHDGFAVKLLDFGIARLQDLTVTSSSAMGTPFYVAIEQLHGAATNASDVYSVGALLWWCLTGQELFAHITHFKELVYHLEAQREPPDAQRVCPTLPTRAAALVGAMLHHLSSARPTMTEFLVAWAAMEPELRHWWASRSRRRVAVLMADRPVSEALVGALQREGHTVLRPAPRAATLLAQPDLDAVVIDAELGEPNPLSLASHLAQILPEARLYAVSTRPFASAWLSAPLRLLAILPEQLPALTDALINDAPSATRLRLSSDFAQRALGEIPELLAGLDACVAQRDQASAVQHCEHLERVAHLASLDEIGSLARTLRVLLEQHAVEDPAGFVTQLTRSFHEAFPALLAAQEG